MTKQLNDPANRRQDLAAVLLRLSLGSVFLMHSIVLKLTVFTLPGTAGYFASLGLPGALAYGVFAVEALGGVTLLLGLFVRPVAIALLGVSLGATWAHLGAGWVFSAEGGGYEFPLFLAAMTAVQALLGAGALRLPNPLSQRLPAAASGLA